MVEKTLNTRMQQKHDSQTNWDKATNFIPKAGEIIIYDADANNAKPRIKIGNGTTKLSALPFITNNADITAALNTLDYSGATANGNATSFITQVTQTDGAINATKATIPVATSNQLGLVKSGTDISVDANGNVSVVNNSHKHTSSNISDLSTTINTAVTNAIGALDAADPTANGTSTTFINTIAQTDGTITATKASVPTANGTTLGLVKQGGDVTIGSGVITINDNSHNHISANISDLATTINSSITAAQRKYSLLVPYNNKIIASVSDPKDINDVAYLRVGTYYCASTNQAKYISNLPEQSAFMMSVSSLLTQVIDNEQDAWVFRVRKIAYQNGQEYLQSCYTESTPGVWHYGDWRKVLQSVVGMSVGSNIQPIYINSKGDLTSCSYNLGPACAKGVASGVLSGNNDLVTSNAVYTALSSYLPLRGGALTGEVTSSVNVPLSSAAFRNVKIVSPTTEIIAGTTAIPTGEIWMRYEE